MKAGGDCTCWDFIGGIKLLRDLNAWDYKESHIKVHWKILWALMIHAVETILPPRNTIELEPQQLWIIFCW